MYANANILRYTKLIRILTIPLQIQIQPKKIESVLDVVRSKYEKILKVSNPKIIKKIHMTFELEITLCHSKLSQGTICDRHRFSQTIRFFLTLHKKRKKSFIAAREPPPP